MEREIRYCTTEDGVRIAYCVEGEGPPLLLCPILFESFSVDHLLPNYQRFLKAIAGQCTLIRYDTRGTGLSHTNLSDLRPSSLVADIEAVVLALGVDRLSICGLAGSGPRAIKYAAENPDRVDRLILLWTYSRALDLLPRPVLDNLVELIRVDWRLGARAIADLGTRDVVESAAKLEDMYVQSATGDSAAALFTAVIDEDVTESLAKIECPVLIVQRTNDPLFTETTREMASRIPGARLVPMAQEIHPFGDMWAPLVDAISRFLGGQAPNAEGEKPSGAFRTVLWTDLVGHTEMMQRLGDAKGRDVLREHERITRDLLKQHGGAEVKTMGDGFLASFGSVTKAVECAVALQRAFAECEGEPLSVRVGLNAGEPIEEDGDLFGATVILASRIAAKAEGGEILVADTVRGLCSGKGFLFADRGEFVAKGIEEPVRVYEVRWRNA